MLRKTSCVRMLLNKIESDRIRSDNGITCIRSAKDRGWNQRHCLLGFEKKLGTVQHAQEWDILLRYQQHTCYSVQPNLRALASSYHYLAFNPRLTTCISSLCLGIFLISSNHVGEETKRSQCTLFRERFICHLQSLWLLIYYESLAGGFAGLLSRRWLMTGCVRWNWYFSPSAPHFLCYSWHIIHSIFLLPIKSRRNWYQQYHDESSFIREHRAYASVNQTPSIHAQTAAFIGIFDRIPELFPDQTHLYSRGICIERIHGPSLNDVIVTLSAAQRDAIREQLRHALGLLHEDAEVVHGDLRGQNVILAEGGARLIDFSHAGFKYDMALWLWDKRKANDFKLLDRIFKEAEEMAVWYLTLSLFFLRTFAVDD